MDAHEAEVGLLELELELERHWPAQPQPSEAAPSL